MTNFYSLETAEIVDFINARSEWDEEQYDALCELADRADLDPDDFRDYDGDLKTHEFVVAIQNALSVDLGEEDDKQFVKVTGEDGVFYDLVSRAMLDAHVKDLEAGGYKVSLADSDSVPPCIYRDFTATADFYSYEEHAWENGTDFYLDETYYD